MAATLTMREHFPSLHISVSAARTLQRCPREYAYRTVLGAPAERTSSRLVLGSSLHRGLAAFYAAMRDGAPLPTVDAMMETVEGALEEAKLDRVPIEYEDGESDATLLSEARELLQAFLRKPWLPAKVLAVEQGFVLDLVHPVTGDLLAEERVVGVFDVVGLATDGTVVVLDHKISRRHVADPGDLQLPLYSRVARMIFGAEHVEASWQVLQRATAKSGARVAVVPCPRREHDEDEALESLASAVALVRAAIQADEPLLVLGRRRSWACGSCGYSRRCETDRG